MNRIPSLVLIVAMLAMTACQNSTPESRQIALNGVALYGAEIGIAVLTTEVDKLHTAKKLDDASWTAARAMLRDASVAISVASDKYNRGEPWTEADTRAVQLAVYTDLNAFIVAKGGIPLPPLALLIGPPATRPTTQP